MTINSQIHKLWQEFASIPFPNGYGGEEIDGIDLAVLDGDTAGCILTFLENNGELDSMRIHILRGCLDDLVAVTKKLDGVALNYFTRIKTLATLVLQETGNTADNA